MDPASLAVGLLSGLALGIGLEEYRRWRDRHQAGRERGREEALCGPLWAEEFVTWVHGLLDYLEGLKEGVSPAAAEMVATRAVARAADAVQSAPTEANKLDRLGDERLASLLGGFLQESQRVGLGQPGLSPRQLAESASHKDIQRLRQLLDEMATRILDLRLQG